MGKDKARLTLYLNPEDQEMLENHPAGDRSAAARTIFAEYRQMRAALEKNLAKITVDPLAFQPLPGSERDV